MRGSVGAAYDVSMLREGAAGMAAGALDVRTSP
jgi:hypothetical protein